MTTKITEHSRRRRCRMQQTRALKIATATLCNFATPLAKSTETHQLATAAQPFCRSLAVWYAGCLKEGWKASRQRREEDKKQEARHDSVTGSCHIRHFFDDRLLLLQGQASCGPGGSSNEPCTSRGSAPHETESYWRVLGTRQPALSPGTHLGAQREPQPGANRHGRLRHQAHRQSGAGEPAPAGTMDPPGTEGVEHRAQRSQG